MSAFAALSRKTGFRSIGPATGTAGRPPRIQPLAVSPRPAGLGGVPRSVGDRSGDAGNPTPDTEEPPPTKQDLEAAEQARLQAEQALAQTHAELRALRAQLEAQRQSTAALAHAFERGLADARQELRAGFAQLVMEGSRRLIGALERHEAVFLARLDEVAELLVLESDVVIKVAPRNKEAAEAAVFGRAGWLVEIDPRLDGGCVAVCRNSTVDASIETAFVGLSRALEAWVADDGAATQARG